jgi:thiol:disulfide interchange protein DsbA
MKLKKTSTILTICFLLIFAGAALGEPIPGVTKDNIPFPSYGVGKVLVRVYTDYFCPPCRGAEHELEPLLVELVKSKKITVTFVDTPIYRDSQFFARRFLYALNKRNDFEHALKVRSVLFEAATNKVKKDSLDEYLKEKGIALTPFEVAPVLTKLNSLLQEDKIDATPTVVIVKEGGKPEKRIGGGEILRALKSIQ